MYILLLRIEEEELLNQKVFNGQTVTYNKNYSMGNTFNVLV